MTDLVTELASMIVEANARITFDSERDIHKPCIRCHRTDVPRSLVIVGHWSRDVHGGMKRGDAIRRPMCAKCIKETE